MEAPVYPESLRNVESEAALLGAMMINNGSVDRVAEIVSGEDFSEPLFARIFNVILSEVGQGRAADPVLLRGHFADDPAMQEMGGVGFLSDLTSSPSIMIGAREFARTVADLAKRRRLLDNMRELTAEVDQIGTPVETMVDRIDTALFESLQREQTTTSATLAQAFDTTMAAIEAEAAGIAPRGILIDGFSDWNDLTGGMRRGDMIVLAGRPSMGKTATAISLAVGAARSGYGVLFVSLEMPIGELVTRAMSDLCYETGNAPKFDDIRRGRLNEFDRRKLAEARAQIEDWGMILTDPAQLKIGRLAMMIRRYQRQMAGMGKTLDVVFVDYLGLIRSDDKKIKRYEEVSEISRAVKRIAKECGVAIVILAQLNREVERREDKRPQLSDLRDSGDIEQDADVVAFVYREEYYLARSEPDVGDKKREAWELSMQAARDRVEIIVPKVRNGAIGKRTAWFFAAHQAVRSSDFYRNEHR